MYNRGRYIEGQWVFGGICRETKACLFVAVGQRDEDTLLPIIHAHILPVTHVISGMWKAYDCLKVNHSLNLVDPNTGAHTQHIENTWWGSQTKSVPRHEIKKQNTQFYCMGLNLRKEIKGRKCGVTRSR